MKVFEKVIEKENRSQVSIDPMQFGFMPKWRSWPCTQVAIVGLE